MGCKKGGKCRKAPMLCLKSLSCGNKNYKVHVAIDMSIVHCTCVLRFLWHWCLYISFCNFQRGSFAWSFLQPRNILSCVKLKRKYHKIWTFLSGLGMITAIVIWWSAAKTFLKRILVLVLLSVVAALALNVMCWQLGSQRSFTSRFTWSELYISHARKSSTDSPLGKCSRWFHQSEASLAPHWPVVRNPDPSLDEWRGEGLRGREWCFTVVIAAGAPLAPSAAPRQPHSKPSTRPQRGLQPPSAPI